MSTAPSVVLDSHPLAWGNPPPWASEWGDDALFGPWCVLTVAGVSQRLRWIRPGRVILGSPEGDRERQPWEFPPHEATFETGFWMFDTPCTQALWEAVMGGNPSEFQGAERPVENVSWEDCQQFVRRINERLAGLKLGLPSESQWEYACRAGTSGSRYGELDEIGWYDKNSGGETHAVATKAANGWGLYDLLGNVWEWCADEWRVDYSRPARSSSAASASRVIRGGSWNSTAQVARAASRSHWDPSDRDAILGFRCVEFREGVVSPGGPAGS